jgi:hypothetical protein
MFVANLNYDQQIMNTNLVLTLKRQEHLQYVQLLSSHHIRITNHERAGVEVNLLYIHHIFEYLW